MTLPVVLFMAALLAAFVLGLMLGAISVFVARGDGLFVMLNDEDEGRRFDEWGLPVPLRIPPTPPPTAADVRHARRDTDADDYPPFVPLKRMQDGKLGIVVSSSGDGAA